MASILCLFIAFIIAGMLAFIIGGAMHANHQVFMMKMAVLYSPMTHKTCKYTNGFNRIASYKDKIVRQPCIGVREPESLGSALAYATSQQIIDFLDKHPKEKASLTRAILASLENNDTNT